MNKNFNLTKVIILAIALVAIIVIFSKYISIQNLSERNADMTLLSLTGNKRKSMVHPSVIIMNPEVPDMDRTVPIYCVPVIFAGYRIPICTYSAADDALISGPFLRGEYIDNAYILNVMSYMKNDSRLQLVDLGANLGAYVLALAQMKRHVLAVEPNYETVKKLRHSVFLGDVSKYVTLLYNAMSDGHETLSLGTDPRNRADTYMHKGKNCTETDPKRCVASTVQSITMNDLIPLMVSNKAVIKIDIQGAEIKCFNEDTAAKFFEVIEVPYIFIEWVLYAQNYWGNPVKKDEIDKWLGFFYRRQYKVYHETSGQLLGPNWNTWSYNVIFKKPYYYPGGVM